MWGLLVMEFLLWVNVLMNVVGNLWCCGLIGFDWVLYLKFEVGLLLMMFVVVDYVGGCLNLMFLGIFLLLWSMLDCLNELFVVVNLLCIDSCVYLLWCERGGDDGGGEIEVIDLWELCLDGFFKYDLSGSFLVGVEVFDLGCFVFFVDVCLIGDGFLGVIFEEFFWDELFYEDFFFGVVFVDEFFINFFGIFIKFEVIFWGGIDNI